MADPCVNTISAPNKIITIIIGAIQNFLRSCIKPHRSFRNSTISRVASSCQRKSFCS